MDNTDSSEKSLKESFDEAIRQLERLQAQFMNGSLPMDMGDLSQALKNQLEFIAKLNADMALEAQVQRPNSAAGTPKRVAQNDPVRNVALDRLHVENVYQSKEISMDEEIDIENMEIVEKEITPLAKRLAPALANMQKSVQVPVRQRTAQTRVAHAPEKKLTFLLPETPIESRRLEEQQSLMTPRVLGVGIEEEGQRDADATTTPGIKAGTPMAIEVLTNLYSLGLQGGGMTNGYDGGKKVSGEDYKGPQGDIANSNKTARSAAAAATRRPRSKKVGPKTCNCKRSKCLKMYCECFAASGFCLPGCSCLGCKNTEENARQVDRAREGILMKDPAAFDDKVNKKEGHKKGCRCKRSKCLKKYCECYNAGVKCNPQICQCVDCCNEPSYRKDKKSPQLEPLENIVPSSIPLDVEGVIEEKAITLQPREGDENAHPVADMFSGEAIAFLTPGGCGDDVISSHVIPGDAIKDAEKASEESKKEKKAPVENCEVPGSLTFKPDSSALVSHFSPALPEMEDTATSPEYKLGGVRKVVSKPPTARRMTSVVSIPPSVRENLELPSSGGSKRPRRAASGGVSGAIAAARADWGLDHISPPLKRATSVPDKVEKSKGTAAASKKERNALLRKVLQQENGPASHGQEDEADAISALVSLNSMGS